MGCAHFRRFMFSAAVLALVCSSSWGQLPALSSQEVACREAAGIDAHGFWVREPTEQAIERCELAAQEQHPDVLAFLGRAYYFNLQGHGAARAEDARRAIQASAAGGSRVGMALMGVLYSRGFGVEVDAERAVEWFRKAAEQGHANAQYNLGVMYEEGLGVVEDDAQAAGWYRRAAANGDAHAQYALAGLYAEGRGLEKDEAQAAVWHRKVAEHGDMRAQYLLGQIYLWGLGVDEDRAEAARWFRRSAEQGHLPAQLDLGVMYARGIGVAQDYEQAATWFRQAAEQGDASAQIYLGAMYEHGLGVKQDLTQAAEWYGIAYALKISRAPSSEQARAKLRRICAKIRVQQQGRNTSAQSECQLSSHPDRPTRPLVWEYPGSHDDRSTR